MLPEIKDILFATDMSPNADNALRYALSLARAHGAKVHVLHVNEPLSPDAIVTLQMFLQDENARTKAIGDRHASVKRMLKDNQKNFLKSLPSEDKPAYEAIGSVELVDGHSAEMILQRSSELKCQMIVMGSHEEGTGHTFLGTVAKRVLRRSPIATLIVPNIE